MRLFKINTETHKNVADEQNSVRREELVAAKIREKTVTKWLALITLKVYLKTKKEARKPTIAVFSFVKKS